MGAARGVPRPRSFAVAAALRHRMSTRISRSGKRIMRATSRRPDRARLRASEQQLPLSRVLREGCGSLELRARLVAAAELEQEVAANAGQEMIPAQRWFAGERVDELEACLWPERHRNGDRAGELD